MLKFAIIVAYIAVSLASDCAKPESIAPCTCEHDGNLINIYCGGNKEINLSEIFKNISKEFVDPIKRDFWTFHLNNTKVNELPENLFAEITFSYLIIENATNLTRVHTNAFKGTKDELLSVAVYNTPLDSNGPDYDLFKAFNSMPELMTITLSNTNLRHIPDNAFGPKNSVDSLEIVNGSVESIGKHAFKQLGNVKNIRLSSNKINNIAEGAFALDGRNILNIELQNNKLDNTNLKFDILAGLSGRSTNLNVTGNQLTYIPENLFGSFMAAPSFNKIIFDNLDCTDCRNSWLVKKYPEIVDLMLKCSDHINIVDKSHFTNC